MKARLRRLLLPLGLIAAAALSALAVIGIAIVREEDGATTPVLPESGVRVDAQLNPRIVLFGDTVRAIVDVTLDRGRFDPESVRVSPQFSPWEIVGRPERERHDSGSFAHVRTTFAIRCMKSPCIPAGQAAPLELGTGRVSFAEPGAAEGEQTRLRFVWPLLVVNSRFAAVRFDDTQSASTPWRADLSTLPAVSYRIAPGALAALLLFASLLLVGGSAALAYVAWPRRVPEPEPEPEPEPLPSLTPLEQALELLEESARVDGAGEQRRALELVAEELDEWGDVDLSGRARVLAWSPDVPSVEQTNALAARVRAELERELVERAEREQNGDGHAA